jgi:hypothetical protein
VGSFDHYTLIVSRLISTLRPEVEQKVADLAKRFPALDAGVLRLRLWIVESTFVLLARDDSTADPARLDGFVGEFWSDIARLLESDFPGQDVSQDFDAGVDRLIAEIASDRQQLAPENVSMAMAKRISDFLEMPEGVPLEYGYKLATSTKLLNHLPD